MISINFYILHEVSMEKIEHIKNCTDFIVERTGTFMMPFP